MNSGNSVGLFPEINSVISGTEPFLESEWESGINNLDLEVGNALLCTMGTLLYHSLINFPAIRNGHPPIHTFWKFGRR